MRVAHHNTAKIFGVNEKRVRRGVKWIIKNKIFFMDFLETNV